MISGVVNNAKISWSDIRGLGLWIIGLVVLMVLATTITRRRSMVPRD